MGHRRTGTVQLADQGQRGCGQSNQTSSLQWISFLLPSVRTSLTLYSVLEVTFIFIYDTLILTILHLHYCSLAGEELTTTVKWRQFVKTAMLQAGAWTWWRWWSFCHLVTASTSDSGLVLHTVHVRMHVCMYACGVHKERERELYWQCTGCRWVQRHWDGSDRCQSRDHSAQYQSCHSRTLLTNTSHHTNTTLHQHHITSAITNYDVCTPAHHITPTPHHTSNISHHVITDYELLCRVHTVLPSVLRRYWLGGRKSIRPVKNRVVGCRYGCLSGARCRLVYGPANATATHCFLLHYNPDWFYLSGTGSPG